MLPRYAGSQLPRAWEDGVATPWHTCSGFRPPVGVRHALAWCNRAHLVNCSSEGILGVEYATCGIGCITPGPPAWIQAAGRRACAAKCGRPPMPLPASLGSPVSADSSRSDLPGGTYRTMCLPLNLCAARPFWCGPKSYFHCARPTVHVCATWPALMMPCRDCGLSSVSTRRRDACYTDACFSRHVGPVVLGRPAVRHLLRPPSQPVASVSLCAAGDTDARGLVTRDSEDSIVGALEAAVRSYLLLQFFAFVHLLLRAVPMKRKAGSANCVIRGSRAAFRGAPLAFVLALCLTVAGAAPDRPGQCVESGTSPINVGGAQGNWADVGQPTFEFDPLPGRPGRLVPGLSPVIGGDMLPQPSVAVQTLYLQRRHRFTAVSKAEFRDAAELLCEAAEALEVSRQGLQLYVVTPQP